MCSQAVHASTNTYSYKIKGYGHYRATKLRIKQTQVSFHRLAMEVFATDFGADYDYMQQVGSGSAAANSSGALLDNDTAAPPDFEFFNCRTSELSRDSITQPFVWSILYLVKDSTPYVATVEAIFFLIAFFWNFFILCALLSNPRTLREQPACVYLLNIALVDVMHSVTVILVSLVSEIEQEFVFGYSDLIRCHLCEFLGFMLMLLVACSLHSLAALSVDRFVLLARPLRYKDYFNWKRATLIVIGCWVISVFIAFPPLAGFGQYEFNTVYANCQPRWTGKTNGIPHIFYALFVGGEAVIPILILMVTNVWTYKIVSGALRKKFKRQKSFRDAPKSEEEQRREIGENRDYRHKQRQLVKVFGALLIAHIISWTPTLTIMIIALTMGAVALPAEVYIFGWISFLSNPVFHPIIESFFVKDLRRKMNKARGRVRNSLKSASGSVMSRTPSLLSRNWSSKSLLRRISSKRFSDIPDSPPISKQTFQGEQGNHNTNKGVSPVLTHCPTAKIPRTIQFSTTPGGNGINSPLTTPVSFTTEVTPLTTGGVFPMPIVLEAPAETEFIGFEPLSVEQASTTITLPKDSELHVRFTEIPGTDEVINSHSHDGNPSTQNGDSNHQNGECDKQESTTGITAVVLSEIPISAVKDDSSQTNLRSSSDSETQMEDGQFEFVPYSVTPV